MAIVLSENPKIAEEAVKKVKVELEVSAGLHERTLEAMAEDAIEIHPELPTFISNAGNLGRGY